MLCSVACKVVAGAGADVMVGETPVFLHNVVRRCRDHGDECQVSVQLHHDFASRHASEVQSFLFIFGMCGTCLHVVAELTKNFILCLILYAETPGSVRQQST